MHFLNRSFFWQTLYMRKFYIKIIQRHVILNTRTRLIYCLIFIFEIDEPAEVVCPIAKLHVLDRIRLVPLRPAVLAKTKNAKNSEHIISASGYPSGSFRETLTSCTFIIYSNYLSRSCRGEKSARMRSLQHTSLTIVGVFVCVFLQVVANVFSNVREDFGAKSSV